VLVLVPAGSAQAAVPVAGISYSGTSAHGFYTLSSATSCVVNDTDVSAVCVQPAYLNLTVTPTAKEGPKCGRDFPSRPELGGPQLRLPALTVPCLDTRGQELRNQERPVVHNGSRRVLRPPGLRSALRSGMGSQASAATLMLRMPGGAPRNVARPASSRATGIRNGEHDT
jgi:hypothetical protein